MGIRILPPDVNICDAQFSVDGKDIRFGLAAISGIGESQVSTIMAAREKDGAFKSFDDFCQRVEGVNRKMLEALIKSGAMDCFGLKRAQMMAMCEQAIGLAQQKQKDSQTTASPVPGLNRLQWDAVSYWTDLKRRAATSDPALEPAPVPFDEQDRQWLRAMKDLFSPEKAPQKS